MKVTSGPHTVSELRTLDEWEVRLYAITPSLLALLPLASYIVPPTLLTCYSCLPAAWPGWTQLEVQKALLIHRSAACTDSTTGPSLICQETLWLPFSQQGLLSTDTLASLPCPLPPAGCGRPSQVTPTQATRSLVRRCKTMNLLATFMYTSSWSIELEPQCPGRFFSILGRSPS